MGLSRLGTLEYLIATVTVVILGVLAASIYSSSSGGGDPREVIIDEVAGYLIAMALLPLSLFNVLGTFIVFRFLDIMKPPPVSFFDLKNRGGVGIMADDIVAGILTNILFHWIEQSGILSQWI